MKKTYQAPILEALRTEAILPVAVSLGVENTESIVEGEVKALYEE